MSFGILEKTLTLALRSSGCMELPPRYNEKSNKHWIKAIILVQKNNLTENYVLAKQRGDGYISYVEDFYGITPIKKIVSIHPYEYLNDSYMDILEDTEQRNKMLKKHFGAKAFKEMLLQGEEHVKAQYLDMCAEIQGNEQRIADIYNGIDAMAGISRHTTEVSESLQQQAMKPKDMLAGYTEQTADSEISETNKQEKPSKRGSKKKDTSTSKTKGRKAKSTVSGKRVVKKTKKDINQEETLTSSKVISSPTDFSPIEDDIEDITELDSMPQISETE